MITILTITVIVLVIERVVHYVNIYKTKRLIQSYKAKENKWMFEFKNALIKQTTEG